MGVYELIFKRTSTFTVAVLAGVFFYERAADYAAASFFDNYNKGKLWKHIKHQYEDK